MASDPPTQTAHSLLDTDLYKLTMQAVVQRFFPNVSVQYRYTNRTGGMKFTKEGFEWVRGRVDALANVSLTDDELSFLQKSCPYFDQEYLNYLKSFRFKPAEQVDLSFEHLKDESQATDSSQRGDLVLNVKGLWIETILYEIPLLALISEAYFKFCSQDWDHDGQEEKAQRKCEILLENGCVLSEFGTRRRRDYQTQDTVVKGCCKAAEKGTEKGWKGKLTGTSNVHFAMKYGIPPVGTVAHEWFMGIAAITNDYENANELGLRYWVETFGPGVLGIALTDTFGSAVCFKALRQPIPGKKAGTETGKQPSYAQVFAGVRQDSGSPADFVKMSREFYDSVGITDKKSIVFSDSLNIELCLEYKKLAEEAGFSPSFGVGTFFTNDFVHKSDGGKSVPLNIVIKLSHADGRHAVKISDNSGKNTGDANTVKEVKARLGYAEQEWKEGDESGRWGQEGR